MTWVPCVLIAFLCGCLPFSVWLGKLLLGLDVRQYGDGNPGATNVFKTGGKMVGLLTLLLDVTKGAVPVGLAYYTLGFRGVPMFLIAIAPILGHVYTPFLGFHGGKALSTALGVWIGLTIWKASLAGVAGVLIGIAVFTTAGWAVMLGLGVIWAVLWVWMRDALLFWVLAGEMIILAWTHRSDLRHGPHLRPWLAKLCFQAKDRSRHG